MLSLLHKAIRLGQRTMLPLLVIGVGLTAYVCSVTRDAPHGTAAVAGSKDAMQNPVARYLEHAELQYEGERQRMNLIAALNDALQLSAADLQAKRYENYQGKKGQWDLPTVLYRHCVPSTEYSSLGNNFYRDVKSPAVQAIIVTLLTRLTAKI
ncbi:MAG: hypothetical protein HY696_03700 [Deltaproteobacteria bacterium]|nr:hypothetical protein [Deltaproteobacteria bacterium]